MPSMNRLSPLVPRLEKLLLMLSSGSDGETLAAVRAIDRTLRTAGADWHDLTGLLATPHQSRKQKNRATTTATTTGTQCAQFCLKARGFSAARGKQEFIADSWRLAR